MGKLTLKKTPKREKIVIHYKDGSTEEYENGILYTIEEIKDESGEPLTRLHGKHCNTRKYKSEYCYGLAQITMAMLEDEDKFFEADDEDYE